MKTLLDGVNEVLKRVSIISENNILTSLSNSGKQVFIDITKQAWNESVDQLYSKARVMKPKQGAESSIVLVQGVREYALATDLIQIRWPLHEEQKGYYIEEYKGGYEELRNIQTQPASFTGQPFFAAMSPIDDMIYIDRSPTAEVAGFTYVYFYWRDTVLDNAIDIFPFNDGVFRALVPYVAEVYKINQKGIKGSTAAQVQNKTMTQAFGRALRMVKQIPDDRTYIKRHGGRNPGPLGHSPFER